MVAQASTFSNKVDYLSSGVILTTLTAGNQKADSFPYVRVVSAADEMRIVMLPGGRASGIPKVLVSKVKAQ